MGQTSTPAETVGEGNRAAEDSRRWSVGLLSGDIFLFWAALYMFVPILSVYARALGASMSTVGLVIGSYGFTQLLIRIPIGLLSDRWGRRRPFVTVAFVITIVSLIGLAWSPNPTWLLVFRALTGVAAATWVTTTVLYSSYFPKDQTVRATGLALFCMNAAIVLVTFAGGALADAYGWTSTFYAAIFPAVLGVILSAFLADDETIQRSGSFSLRSLMQSKGARLLIISSGLAAVTQYASYSTTFSFAPIYAADLGASKMLLGMLSMAVLLPNTLATLAATHLADRVGERNIIAIGFVLMALTSACIPLIGNLSLLMASRVLFGVGQGFVHPVTMGLSIKHVDREQRASAMGFFQAVYALGMFGGPALSGLLADYLGIAGMFYVIGSTCVVASAFALTLLNNRS